MAEKKKKKRKVIRIKKPQTFDMPVIKKIKKKITWTA